MAIKYGNNNYRKESHYSTKKRGQIGGKCPKFFLSQIVVVLIRLLRYPDFYIPYFEIITKNRLSNH